MKGSMASIAKAVGTSPEEVEQLGKLMLAVDVPKLNAAAQAAAARFSTIISNIAAAQTKAQRELVERRLLAGENRVEVPYLPGRDDGRTLVYTVPAWGARPIRRLRIEWRRWCWRRSKAGLLAAVDGRES